MVIRQQIGRSFVRLQYAAGQPEKPETAHRKELEIMKPCKKQWAQAGTALVCSLAIVLSAFPTFAEDSIDELEGQSSALEAELAGINEDILELSDQISSTEMQVTILNGEIERTSDALSEAEADAEQQYEDMKTRIKYMYEHGNATLLEMLFSAENMSDFLNKAEFIENLSSYDRDALESLQAVQKQIADEKDTLEVQQASLTDLQSSLETQQEELQAKADATSTDLADVQKRLEEAKEAEAARIAAEEAARKAALEASASAGNSSGGSGSYDDSVISSGSISVSTDDLTLLAAMIQCEAYQQYDYLLAVATVIMNRVESPRFPNTIREVIFAPGQFEPSWSGRLNKVLNEGPTALSLQVAQDAINGARLAAVADCYYFLYAGTGHSGINIGNNVFFQSWT